MLVGGAGGMRWAQPGCCLQATAAGFPQPLFQTAGWAEEAGVGGPGQLEDQLPSVT